MKSAYAILGIPGNASVNDIESAYQHCRAHYSKERLAADPKALEQFKQVQDAYEILIKPEFRAAYDRKLGSQVNKSTAKQPRVVIEKEETPWFTKPLNLIAISLFVLMSSAAYMTYARNQERKEQAARELAEQKRQVEEAQRAKMEQDMADTLRAREAARAQAEADQRERQLRAEGNASLAMAARTSAQSLAIAETERREALRREQLAKQEERQRVQEAENRVRKDKQIIRELCYQNYGRSNC